MQMISPIGNRTLNQLSLLTSLRDVPVSEFRVRPPESMSWSSPLSLYGPSNFNLGGKE